ncbi:hypothetical protein ACWU37_21000 (plasmid) [Photobacterium damselae subsp. damselae]|uniref:hypothetical protein n=1 Tax=Photobacterium damselae TaxID=38293 RepID=UPI001F1AC0B2|nr:hypothetical protein [Photobacterium damselae]UKA12820.1 hypothetical protein IHC91_21240 [Photobacterium damselae subsp. damselae]
MAGGVRFSEEFVQEQMEKRKRLKAKGRKAGHGGNYSITQLGSSRDCSAAIKRTRAAKQKQQGSSVGFAQNDAGLNNSVSMLGLPDWLKEIIKTDGEIKRGLIDKRYKPESPHKEALIALAKDITLMTGRKANATTKGRQANYEHYIQVRIFYCLERDFPNEYYFVKAVPNGGLRHNKTAFDMLAEGQKKGALDIDIELARGKYHGMKLEVKAKNGSLSKFQSERIERLNEQGYYATCQKDFDDCWSSILNYFALPEFDNITEITKP